MAVNINSVYQKVLALANKEQRGYITPQEFNYFADQAQLDIFEGYFNDLARFLRMPSNDTVYADKVDAIQERIDVHEKFKQPIAMSNNVGTIPTHYKLGKVFFTNDFRKIKITIPSDVTTIVDGDFITLPFATTSLETGSVNVATLSIIFDNDVDVYDDHSSNNSDFPIKSQLNSLKGYVSFDPSSAPSTTVAIRLANKINEFSQYFNVTVSGLEVTVEYKQILSGYTQSCNIN